MKKEKQQQEERQEDFNIQTNSLAFNSSRKCVRVLVQSPTRPNETHELENWVNIPPRYLLQRKFNPVNILPPLLPQKKTKSLCQYCIHHYLHKAISQFFLNILFPFHTSSWKITPSLPLPLRPFPPSLIRHHILFGARTHARAHTHTHLCHWCILVKLHTLIRWTRSPSCLSH